MYLGQLLAATAAPIMLQSGRVAPPCEPYRANTVGYIELLHNSRALVGQVPYGIVVLVLIQQYPWNSGILPEFRAWCHFGDFRAYISKMVGYIELF